jgi:hypothetical protein
MSKNFFYFDIEVSNGNATVKKLFLFKEPLINSVSRISVAIKSIACASVFLEKTALIRGSLKSYNFRSNAWRRKII